MPSSLDPARRAALVGSKLATIVADAGAEVAAAPAALGTGAAVVDHEGTAWVLLGDQPARGLGGALGWAVRRGAVRLHVIAESGTGTLLRRAAGLTFPVRVSHLEGRVLVEALAEPLAEPQEAPERHRALVPLIVEGGALPVEEHGVVAGEVHGLEVCRVVDDPVTGEVRLEVGVGAHDRETFQMLHGDRPTVEALAGVVRSVAAHRAVGAAQHPLNQLAASRLLRSRLLADPELLGVGELHAVAPPIARTNVKDQVPCVALAPSTATLVVCTHGVELDAVPYACDALTVHPADRCVIAAPERDVLEIQHALAALVRTPTRFVGVP